MEPKKICDQNDTADHNQPNHMGFAVLNISLQRPTGECQKVCGKINAGKQHENDGYRLH